LGLPSCKELREATLVRWSDKGLSADDLATLGLLGSVLPALRKLSLGETSGSAGPDGVQRLAEGLSAGALPAVTHISISTICTWAKQAPRRSLPPWTEAPCRGSRTSF